MLTREGHSATPAEAPSTLIVVRPLAWTRGGVVGLAALLALAALRPPGDIIAITIFSGSLYAVCFFPALVFGLHWRQGSANAVLASMALGIVVLIGWLLFGLGAYVHEVFPALFASCVTYALVARLTPNALARWLMNSVRHHDQVPLLSDVAGLPTRQWPDEPAPENHGGC